jgi:hypothetical protein
MKKFFFLVVLLFSIQKSSAQNSQNIQVDYFRGMILSHNNLISHLTTGHPKGFLLSWHKATYGDKKWERLFNYPDIGYSFSYLDYDNKDLGRNFAIHGFRIFHIGKAHTDRSLLFKLGFGISYSDNPFSLENNTKNTAIGSNLGLNTYFQFNYKWENIFFERLGFQSGITFIHQSNGAIHLPNLGVNTLSVNFGLNYNFNQDKERELIYVENEIGEFDNSIKYIVSILGGVNSSDEFGGRFFPFATLSGGIIKHFTYKHNWQVGADFFASSFERENIIFENAQGGRKYVDPDDYLRFGIYIGYGLRMYDLEMLIQTGYYLYQKKTDYGKFYNRMGLKKHLNSRLYAQISVKAHLAKAESLELGIGYKF